MEYHRKAIYRNASGDEAAVFFHDDDSATIRVDGGDTIVENAEDPFRTVQTILIKKGYTLFEMEKTPPSFHSLKRLCLPGVESLSSDFIWTAWVYSRNRDMQAEELLATAPEMVVKRLRMAARSCMEELDDDDLGIIIGNWLTLEMCDSPGFVPREFIRTLAGED